jgi:hypothetical protein
MANAKRTIAGATGKGKRGKAAVSPMSPVEQFIALPDVQKQRVVAEFDKEFVPTRPLTPAQRKLWRKAKRKPGRPRVGEGREVVSLSVEKGLLRRADALARQRKQSRSQLMTEALQDVLSRAKAG